MTDWLPVLHACPSLPTAVLQGPVQFEYVQLHYTTADGEAGVFRASPEHGIMLPTTAIDPANPQAVPGTGAVKSMSKVKVSPPSKGRLLLSGSSV
jgi:hypothetical protein